MPSHVSARDLISVCIITLLGAALALAGGSGGLVRADVSVLSGAAGLAFGMNWLVYVPSALARTEHYYDLTGELTYLSVTGLAVVLSQPLDLSTLVVGMVSIWAIRLAGFLFVRVKRVGKDIRFDSVKTKAKHFFGVVDSASVVGVDHDGGSVGDCDRGGEDLHVVAGLDSAYGCSALPSKWSPTLKEVIF